MEADTSTSHIGFISNTNTVFQNDLFLESNGSGILKNYLLENFIITGQKC